MANPIRLYLDEDAQRASLIRALRVRQFDVLTANEAQQTGATDAEQLVFATQQHRSIFTFNRGDFVSLHTERMTNGLSHAGIIISNQLEIGVIVRRLLRLLDKLSAEDMQNGLAFLSNWR